MKTMNADQAVEIARSLIKECTADSASTMYGVLSPAHINAITLLADIAGEICCSTDLVRTVETLIERGQIRLPMDKRGKTRNGGDV